MRTNEHRKNTAGITLGTLAACLLILFVILVGGCENSQQRLATLNTWISQASELSAKLDTKAEQIQAQLTRAEQLLSDPNVTSDLQARIAASVAKANEELTRVMEDKTRVDAAVGAWQGQLDATLTGDVGLAEEAAAYGSGAMAISDALPPPWNMYVWIGGLILTTISGIVGVIGGKRVEKKNTVQTMNTLVDVIKSVDVLIDNYTDQEKAVFRETLGKAQSISTRNMVRAIKAPKAA